MRVVSISDTVFKVASALETKPEDLLEHALARYLAEELATCERRLGRLYLNERELRRKYGMELAGLGKQLEALEKEEHFEELTVGDTPVLEAVSDTRHWEHLLEHISQEENRLRRLRNLVESDEKRLPVTAVTGS